MSYFHVQNEASAPFCSVTPTIRRGKVKCSRPLLLEYKSDASALFAITDLSTNDKSKTQEPTRTSYSPLYLLAPSFLHHRSITSSTHATMKTVLGLVALQALAAKALRIVHSNDDGWAELNTRTFHDALLAAGHHMVLSCPADDQSRACTF